MNPCRSLHASEDLDTLPTDAMPAPALTNASDELVDRLADAVREFRRGALDCPLAAMAAAYHRRRRRGPRSVPVHVRDSVRGLLSRECADSDPVLVAAAVACHRAHGATCRVLGGV